MNQAVEGFVVDTPVGALDMGAVSDADILSSKGLVSGYSTAFHEALKINGLEVERVEGLATAYFTLWP